MRMGEVERQRAELERMKLLHEQQWQNAVHRLSEVARGSLKIGPLVAEKPWHWLAGAFALGLWFGTRTH